MKDLLTFSSDNPTIIELLDQGIHFSEYMLNEFEVEKNQKFPTIIQSKRRSVQVMKWGVENPIMSTGPELFYLFGDRKSTRLNSSHVAISYAVFCLKKKKEKYNKYNSIK